MAGIFGLSIDPRGYGDSFLDDLFLGVFYLQHLGEEYCGISTSDGQNIKIQTHHGLFWQTFRGKLQDFRGTSGIGFCGTAREPFRLDTKMGEIILCFSGNVINLPELLTELKKANHTFERGDDIEIIAKLIVQGKDVVDGIRIMARKIKGAYSLLVLTKDGIYAARSPNGHWSLVVGKKEGAVVVASESGGFPNYGVKLVRDIKPGEIVLIKNGDLETKDIIHSERIQFCSFFWVYTAFPNAVLEGISASLVRKRLGAALARRDIKRGFIPDIVIPVPYSGIFHALGYHEEFCRQAMEGKISRIPPFDFALLKFPWSGRSFTPPDARTRKFKAHVKLLISGENYAGKTVVACDDSVVRGTQTKTVLMPKLRSIGIEDVHLRVSNPPLLSHCPWGKTTKKGEPLAYRMPEKADRVDFLGVKSLEYNTVEDLVQAIGLPAEQLCVDCDLVCGS